MTGLRNTDVAPVTTPPKRLTKAELAARLQRATAALYAESGAFTTTAPTRVTVTIYA